MTDSETTRILHFSIGPVQGFVSQARRTRDLWAGSFLLAYLSGQAMKAVLDGCGKVVFPTVHEPPDGKRFGLEKCVPTDALLAAIIKKPLKDKEQPQIGSLPNRFKAEVPEGFDPQKCRQAILDAWEKTVKAVWEKFVAETADELGNGTRTIWERQIKNFWEIVWVTGDAPTDKSDNTWLDARKNWRNPASLEPEGGDHCTVMHAWQELSGWTWAKNGDKQCEFWKRFRNQKNVGKLDLRDDERLCAIALVKRLFPKVAEAAIGWKMDTRNWPSTAYMAAVPWLETLLENLPAEALDYTNTVEAAFYEGAFGERTTRLACLDRFDTRYRRVSGLDGNAFHPAALRNERVTPLKDESRRDALGKELDAINRLVGHQARDFYALLLMDGDSLGALLRQHDAALISQALADFTGQVSKAISANNGVTVYAGGDDVLALLPARDALVAALLLEDSYRKAFAERGIAEATISAAIVYAHYKQPLATVLHTAHTQLDDIAKEQNGRASVAAAVMQSSGVNIEWVASFESGAPSKLVELAEKFVEPKPPFSTGFLYGLRDLFGLWPSDDVRAGKAPEPPLKEGQLQQLLVAEAMNDRERSLDCAEAEQRVGDLLPVIRFHRRGDAKVANHSKPPHPSPLPEGEGIKQGIGLQPSGARLARFLAQPGDDA